jgi:hypothetical protein
VKAAQAKKLEASEQETMMQPHSQAENSRPSAGDMGATPYAKPEKPGV